MIHFQMEKVLQKCLIRKTNSSATTFQSVPPNAHQSALQNAHPSTQCPAQIQSPALALALGAAVTLKAAVAPALSSSCSLSQQRPQLFHWHQH